MDNTKIVWRNVGSTSIFDGYADESDVVAAAKATLARLQPGDCAVQIGYIIPEEPDDVTWVLDVEAPCK